MECAQRPQIRAHLEITKALFPICQFESFHRLHLDSPQHILLDQSQAGTTVVQVGDGESRWSRWKDSNWQIGKRALVISRCARIWGRCAHSMAAGGGLVLCDLRDHHGKFVSEAPRSLLQQQVAALAKKRLTCNIASELEFFLFTPRIRRVQGQLPQPARLERLPRGLPDDATRAG